MQFQIIEANSNFDYIAAVKNKALHMVGFAEEGLSCFRAFLEFSFGYKIDDAIRICERINHTDKSGSIYPQGYLTGMPVRFFRSALNHRNITQFRLCLRDAFVANRDYCKSKEMVFHYACGISNRDEIIDETIRMTNDIIDDPILETVTIVADSSSANTALQRTAFGNSWLRR